MSWRRMAARLWHQASHPSAGCPGNAQEEQVWAAGDGQLVEDAEEAFGSSGHLGLARLPSS